MKITLFFAVVTFQLLMTSAANADNQPSPPAVGPYTDQDAAFLKVPGSLAGSTDFTVAEMAPQITFSSVGGLEPIPDIKDALWGNFGEGVYTSSGRFVVAIGNNMLNDGDCFLYEYDPATHKYRRVFRMSKTAGTKAGEWGHGKFHGRLDESRDGWIYLVSYQYIEPELPISVRTRINSRLARYNTRTGDDEDLGGLLFGDSFPMNVTDTSRGMLYGIGQLGNFIAYDLNSRKPLYAGPLPENCQWAPRATLLDPKTGCCYGSEPGTRRILKFDPRTRVFTHIKALVPPHPIAGKGKESVIRSYTRQRLRDGSILVMTNDGILFKFFPDEERTQLLGLNFGEGLYCCSMALSPDERYIYYTGGIHAVVYEPGPPLVQYDLQTNKKKVIAFLYTFYQDKYQYKPYYSYSINTDAEGKNLFLVWNGRFINMSDNTKPLGHPAFMHVEIPASERPPGTIKAKQ